MDYIKVALNPTRILNHTTFIKQRVEQFKTGRLNPEELYNAAHIELQFTHTR